MNELASESFRISFIIILIIFSFAVIIMTTIIYLFFLSVVLSIMTAIFTVFLVIAVFTVFLMTTIFTIFFMTIVFAVYSVTAIFIISIYFFFFFFFFFSIILVCNCSSMIKSYWRVRKDEEDIWSVLYLKDKQDLTSNNQTKAHRDETHSECSDMIYKWFERYDRYNRFNVCYLLNCYTSKDVRWNDSCI